MMVLQKVGISRAGSGEPGIEVALELAAERNDPFVVRHHPYTPPYDVIPAH
ncbi:UNVERIFIED_ORG: hypothetical protein M2435_004169 [Rhizobium sophorae]|uniref:hypothetical protein n=1 Tax=Rhizobium leguminosarum TaxID=384 RepID=UPI0013F43812|nr:hypothetical protein [Rhizobium leguminosarum]MBB4524174.1 hypothetical protein [Rhizobium leguminosarum]MDH6661252.1 hypothetical protein [Rhizobium sophorae]